MDGYNKRFTRVASLIEYIERVVAYIVEETEVDIQDIPEPKLLA